MTRYLYLVGSVACGYDEYDAFVVCATTPDRARKIAAEATYDQQTEFLKADVENLGTANNKQRVGVVLGSFNAG